MANIMVTGGAGYIGSHTCKRLAQQGHLPVVYDNLVYGHESSVKWGPLIVGDIADKEKLLAVFTEHQISAVIHFAAYAYVGESVSHPAKYYRNNVAGTIDLLEAMRSAGVSRLIFSSTCATYGIPSTLPIPASHPQNPINPYGRSKLMIEQIIADYVSAYDMRARVLRYFNAAGADPDLELGEQHDPETHLIPNIIRAALGELSHIEIYGDDYDTPDGSCIRDYIHVMDLAEAHILALDGIEKKGAFEAHNLGTGTGYSVFEVVEAVKRVSGREISSKTVARRAGDPPVLIAEADMTRTALGWQPQMSDLDQIVSTAYAWHSRKAGQLQ